MSNLLKSAAALAVFAFAMMASPAYFVERERPLTSTAEAIVGRPATPVSAAGVARRTVRRCAAGAYRC
jgi:hypothetical protein